MSREPQPTPSLATAVAFEEEPVQAISRLPVAASRPLGWARENLFSSWWNAGLTLICALLLWEYVPRFIDWALISARWTGTPEECRAVTGACWAIITQKHRLILFGVYPFEEHWRPLLATSLFLVMLGISAIRIFWRPWLAGAWLGCLIAMAVLMWGGVFGLSYVENDRWGGLPITLMLAIFAIALAFPLSILLALGRQSDLPAVKAICTGFIELMRGVPLVSVLFMASVMFPLFLPEGVTIDKLLRALVGLALFTAAYLAEAIRGGLQAIPAGQHEAADAMGLSYWQKMRLIILPQALRLVIPPIVNQFISCLKDTSLVTIVGLYDLLTAAKVAMTDPDWRPYFVEAFVFAGLLFWLLCFSMSRYSQWLERELNKANRR